MANYTGDGFQRFSNVSTGYEFLICILFYFPFFFFPLLKKRHCLDHCVSFLSRQRIRFFMVIREILFSPLAIVFFFHDWKIIPSFLSLPLNLISQLKISANRGWLAIIPISKRDRVSRWTKAILTSSSPSSFLANFSFPQKQRNIPLFLSPLPLYFCLSINSLLSLTHSLEGRCSLKNF